MAADPLVAIVSYLEDDSELAGIVSGRIFGGELPREEVPSMPRSCVVITASGRVSNGLDRSYARIGVPRYDCRFYAEDQITAMRCYWAANRAMRAMRPHDREGVRLLNALIEGGPMSLVDQDTDWPLVWASYGVTASEMVVAQVVTLSGNQGAPGS